MDPSCYDNLVLGQLSVWPPSATSTQCYANAGLSIKKQM